MLGIIDIGTGSIKASVYDGADQKYPEVAFESTDFRLLDLSKKQITEHSQAKALKILKNLVNFIKKFPDSQIIAVATASVRSASNAHSFLETVKRELELSINVLSGEQEARLIADSVALTERLNKFFSFDIGGGSVELNIFDHVLTYSASKNIGIITLATILKEKSQTHSLGNVHELLNPTLLDLKEQCQKRPLVCTGGSMIVASEILKIGNTLSYETVFELYQKVHKMDFRERMKLGIPIGKVDIFDLALAVTLVMMETSEQSNVRVSRANVRHGAAINHGMFE